MLYFKEKFIPAFILVSCLAIILFSYEWTDNKPIENINNNINQEKTEKLSLFKNSQKIEQLTENQNTTTEQKIEEENTNIPETNIPLIQDNTIKYLTIEAVLAEIEDLSSKLVDRPQNSTTCSLCSANNEFLEEALLMVGFPSWEEYFSSEKFLQGLAYYKANENLFWKDEYSTSLCEDTLAVGAGGCSCDNADGPCYTDTSHGRIWHCAGLCCCACCAVCCGL